MSPLIRHAGEADAIAIESLLSRNTLPVDGVRERLATTLVETADQRVIGTAALELFDDGALLRSVAVETTHRGSGAGARLVEAALALASKSGVPAVYLLTTTAEDYFPRFGFARIERDGVPRGVRASVEFTSACPASAAVMRKAL